MITQNKKKLYKSFYPKSQNIIKNKILYYNWVCVGTDFNLQYIYYYIIEERMLKRLGWAGQLTDLPFSINFLYLYLVLNPFHLFVLF